jgi:hypothetical protein
MPSIDEGATVAYRGWMLKADAYEGLVRSIVGRKGAPMTSLEDYLSTHHLLAGILFSPI